MTAIPRTTMHISVEQSDKIKQMRATYTHKTKVICSRNDFLDFMINAAGKEVNDLPITEIVDGKIVEKGPENTG